MQVLLRAGGGEPGAAAGGLPPNHPRTHRQVPH